MNRKPTRIPVDPHEWFSGAIYHLTKTVLSKIWNVSNRTMERWSADSTYTESVTKNPLVMLGITLEKLMEKGKADFARACVDLLAQIVGCQLACDGETTPDKENLSDELLDDLPAVTELHTAIINREPETIVRNLLSKAKRELDEDYQAYLKHM